MTFEISRRSALALGLAAALIPGTSRAQAPLLVQDMTLGDPDAPVKLVEYAMFTCPHCANFHRQVLPQIKATYIDTGKVELIYREVYFNRPSLWAAMIARCAPADRYFGIVDELFRTQADWAGVSESDKMMEQLYGIGRQAGLTDAEMDACVSDRARAEALVAAYQENARKDGIEATPTFFINGKKQPNTDYPAFAALIDAALAEAGQ